MSSGIAGVAVSLPTQGHAELVCGMDLQLLEVLLEAVPVPGRTARLAPAPGRCRVRLEESTDGDGAR